MLASQCPEFESRWTHEYEILNFVRRCPRIWSNNQSIADANTLPTEGPTALAEPHTTVAEPYTMAAEPRAHTMVAERCNFSSSNLPNGQTKATR